MIFVCAVISLLLGTANSQCIRLPTNNEIQLVVQNIVSAISGEESVGTVALLSHHFTCIAPTQKMSEIQQVSIAIVFNFTTNMGVPDTRRQQIQLQCAGVNNYVGTSTALEESPPAVAFTLTTREDCFLCVPEAPSGITVDTDAKCAGESLSDLILSVYLYFVCSVSQPVWRNRGSKSLLRYSCSLLSIL